jgi:hypothetical protein
MGTKAHVCIDPDSELIDALTVTAGNVPDRAPVNDLLAPVAEMADKPVIFADSAYADGETLDRLEGQGFEVMAKVPPAANRDGSYSKDDFIIGLGAGVVTCPAGQTAAIRFGDDGSGTASLGKACTTCPLAERCTTNSSGRTVTVHRHEQVLQAHKADQAAPEWQEAYKGTRPKVERKIGHLVRKPWGGRKARPGARPGRRPLCPHIGPVGPGQRPGPRFLAFPGTGGGVPRPARGHRGPHRPALDRGGQPVAGGQVAPVHGRPHSGRCSCSTGSAKRRTASP